MRKKELRRITPREVNILRAIVKQCGAGPTQMTIRQIVIELLQTDEIEGF